MLGDTLDGDGFLAAGEVRIKNYQADSGGYRCFTDSLPLRAIFTFTFLPFVFQLL